MVEVGLLCVPGSMPLYERFGRLPTKPVVRPEDLDSVDLLIIPPGNIVESGGLSGGLGEAIVEFAEDGGLILGVCSGLQLLAEEVDTGLRRVEGLGLLRLRASRLVGLDPAEVRVVDRSWLTRGLEGRVLKGLHIHTYGRFEGPERPVLESRLPRHNYFSGPITIPSGFISSGGNVIGVLPHKLLDANPEVRENVLRELGVTDDRVVIERNRELVRMLRRGLGVGAGVAAGLAGPRLRARGGPKAVAVVSCLTGEGKTFITAGLAGLARATGLEVRVAKLGSDLRDLHPALYLIRGGIDESQSIAIGASRGTLGWTPWREALAKLAVGADLIIVEGVMGVLTGSCRRCGCVAPCSTLEFLKCSGLPAVLVTSCRHGGVEDAAFRAGAYARLLIGEGIRVLAVVVNEVYGGDTEERYLRNSLSRLGIPAYLVRSADVGRHSTPEVDLNLHKFSLEALRAVGKGVGISGLESMLRRAPTLKAGTP